MTEFYCQECGCNFMVEIGGEDYVSCPLCSEIVYKEVSNESK